MGRCRALVKLGLSVLARPGHREDDHSVHARSKWRGVSVGRLGRSAPYWQRSESCVHIVVLGGGYRSRNGALAWVTHWLLRGFLRQRADLHHLAAVRDERSERCL